MKIPAVVGTKRSESLRRRKDKGSQAMLISLGLVGPKVCPNWSTPKGKPVNIPAPGQYVRQRKPDSRRIGLGSRTLSRAPKAISPGSSVMLRTGLRPDGAVWLEPMPGAHEKGIRKDLPRPYPEPAQVLLAE